MPLTIQWVAPTALGISRALAKACKGPSVLTALDDRQVPILADLHDEDDDREVLGLSELVRRVTVILREPTRPIAREYERDAVLASVLTKLSPESPLSACQLYAGLRKEVADVLTELRHYGITADELSQVATVQGIEGDRLAELTHLMVAESEGMASVGRTHLTEVLLGQIGRELPERATFAGIGQLVVLTGSRRLPVACAWLRWLADLGLPIVALIESLGPESPTFSQAALIAQDLGVDQPVTTPEAAGWLETVFSERKATEAPEVSMLVAHDPMSEAEWAVREAFRSIEAGVPMDQIAFVARDTSVYAPLLLAAARQLQLPVMASYKIELGANSLIQFLMRILTSRADGDVREWAVLAKSSYLNFDSEVQRNIGEAVFEARRSRGKEWDALEQWSEAQGEVTHALTNILSWYRIALQEDRSYVGWLEHLQALFVIDPFPERVAGELNPTRDRDLQAKNRLEIILSQFASVTEVQGSGALSFQAWVRFLKQRVDEGEVWSARRRDGGVRLVSDPGQAARSQVVLALGVVESAYPTPRTENALLSDADRALLERELPTRPALPRSPSHTDDERDAFVRLCGAASGRLVFLMPESQEEREATPSYYVERLEQNLGAGFKRVLHGRENVVPTAAECTLPFDLNLRLALDGRRDAPPLRRLQTDAAKGVVRPHWVEGVEIAELASGLNCAFQSACRHRLNLRAKGASQFQWRLPKIPVRANLATQPDANAAKAALESALDETLDEVFPHADRAELNLLEAHGRRAIVGWLQREFSMREQLGTGATSSTAQVRLGEHGTGAELKLPGRTLKLKGTAPAITQQDGIAFVHLFHASAPSSRLPNHDTGPHLDEHRWFETYLWMLSLFRVAPTFGASVDSMSGERQIIVIWNAEEWRALKNNVRWKRLPAERGPFARHVMDLVQRSFESLDAGEMAPTPGQACERCLYGELCRVSSQFGEALLPEEGSTDDRAV